MSKKVHCILCDRKDPMMAHRRIPRNGITVPICLKCVDRFKLYDEITCLSDIIGPVIDELFLEYIHEKEGH